MTGRSLWGMGLAVALGLAMPAAAQDTVKVGNETKRTRGTVVSLTAGDIACYVKLKDERGATVEEMADFPICEQRNLIGKRVALTWATRKVMSPECQGDMNCKKSATVALIVGARIETGAATAQATTAPARKRTSFCAADETVVFNCLTASRIVSVCTPKAAAPGGGWLEYRFGKPDAEKPDIVEPDGRMPPSRAATGGTIPFSGGGAAWLRFSNGQIQSTVYTAIGKFGPKGEIQERAGLVAHRAGKEIASLKCIGQPTSLLGPDWFDRVGIKDKGQDFDLPE